MGQDFPFGIEDVMHLLNLRVRRPSGNGVYTDCPFCGDMRGKMRIDFAKNVWRCNYCCESGGMLQLYGRLRGMNNSEAYHEICDELLNGVCFSPQLNTAQKPEQKKPVNTISTAKAEDSVIHATLTGLLGLLKLSEQHREHLRIVRGLSDDQIERLGYKSTPPFYMCNSITDKLLEQGYTVEGVPGFYQKNGRWTVNFSTIAAGILLPIRGIDGMIRSFQIRLDTPLKNEDDPPDKAGAKYISFSSANKPMGCSPGSPVHFVGNPYARVVYVTEGVLKPDVAHCLMNRTFVSTIGANNTAQLELIFAFLAENGTQIIMEAHDMDKYSNANVAAGSSKVFLLARKYGMECRRLTWNPNYKGIDDWQLYVKRKKEAKENKRMDFRRRFIYGLCDFNELDSEVQAWHEGSGGDLSLHEFLGFTDGEWDIALKEGYHALKELLLSKRREQKYRIYQLDIGGGKVIPFAFADISGLHKAGYAQPPASEYQMVCDSMLYCAEEDDEYHRLLRLVDLYSEEPPEDYIGRSLAPSDVLELYDDTGRKYFYRDKDGFHSVSFSPMFAKAAETES